MPLQVCKSEPATTSTSSDGASSVPSSPWWLGSSAEEARIKEEARAMDQVNSVLTTAWPGGHGTTYHMGSTNAHLQVVKVEMDPLEDALTRSNAQAVSATLPSTSDVLTIPSLVDTTSLGPADPGSNWNVLDSYWPQSDVSRDNQDAQLYAFSHIQDAAGAAAAAAHNDPACSILTARNNNKKRAFQRALRHSIFGALPRDLQPRTMRELEYESRLRNRRPQNKKWDKWEDPRPSYTPPFTYACYHC